MNSTQMLEEAYKLAETEKTWADLSNALFDPFNGLVQKYITNPADREKFRQSDAYQELYNLIENKMKETGVINGAEPTKKT